MCAERAAKAIAGGGPVAFGGVAGKVARPAAANRGSMTMGMKQTLDVINKMEADRSLPDTQSRAQLPPTIISNRR